MKINNLSLDDRPREKMMRLGAEALSNAELLAILIGSGSLEESSVELMQHVLSDCNNNLNTLGIIRKTKRSKKVRRSVPTRKTKRSFFSSPSTRKTPQKNLRRFTFLIHYISDIQIKSHSLVTTEQQLCTLYIILIYVYVAQVQGYALQG